MFAANPLLDDQQFEMVVYYKDRIKKTKHRDNGPAVTAYKTDGSPLAEHWYYNNQLHRQDGPAFILYFFDINAIRQEEWYFHGRLHRIGAPAVTIYNYDGSILCQQWYEAGKLHRADGPAWIENHPEKNSHKEMWYRRGRLHREDGPAVTVLIGGQTVNRSYYLDGVQKMTSNL